MEQHTAETLKGLRVTTIRSIRQAVATLSGGQRQSVAVARAVMWNSKLVILDEPTAALGVAQTEQVLELVRRLGRAGARGRPHLAQPARHLRDGDPHHRPPPRPQRGRLRARDDAHSRRSCTRSPPGFRPRSQASRRPMPRWWHELRCDVASPGIGLPGGAGHRAPEGLWQRAHRQRPVGKPRRAPGRSRADLDRRRTSAFTATNFFTAPNFVNVILQMAGVTMIAFGVVFVLLLGEIDLSVAYVSGIAAVAVAEFQLADSGHDFPGWMAILLALGIVALIGLGQGTVVAKIGVPSFVVTLAGLLIFQGVILKVLQSSDTILIEDDWVNYTATYYFSANAGWLIAARHHRRVRPGRALRGLGAATRRPLRERRDGGGRSSPAWRSRASARWPSATTPRCRRHARRARRSPRTAPEPWGCRSRRSSCSIFLVGLTYPRQAHGLRPPRLRGRGQRRGRATRRHQRRARSDHRVHDLLGDGRRRRNHPRGAAPVREPERRRRNAPAGLDLGGRHRRRQPLRRAGRGARRPARLARHRDDRERPEHRRLHRRGRSTS